jgi:hypothetical protein
VLFSHIFIAYLKDYKILAFQILQWTDLSTSTNKYFALEVHEATDPSNDEDCWRIYAHHGSLAALLTMKNGGKREVRHLQSQKEVFNKAKPASKNRFD